MGANSHSGHAIKKPLAGLSPTWSRLPVTPALGDSGTTALVKASSAVRARSISAPAAVTR